MADTLKRGTALQRYLNLAGVVILAILFAAPFYLLVVVSLKTTLGAYTDPLTLPLQPNWESYATVLAGAGMGVDLVGALGNSLIITAVSCALLIAVGSVTAYTLARNPGKVSNILFVVFVIGIIVPSQLGIVPLYTWLRTFDLVGNAPGMILVYLFKQVPLTVFLYTGFFRQLPVSYEEAALIDGATRFQIFTRVVMPQMNAVTGTAILLNALYIWNDLFDQLVFLSGSSVPTLPVAIYQLTFTNVSQWNLIFAAVVISLLPMVILYLFTQKKMMASLGGGLKG